MSDNLSQSHALVRRCAVCKIDLKGKFVYIDDSVEELLGYSKEELFGKTLLEYLDASSQELLTGMLNERNNYETFYDAACLTLLNKQKKEIQTDVVVSLNFIAGNPVNFQIIIEPNYSREVKTAVKGYRESRISLPELLEHNVFSDHFSLVSYLYSLVGGESGSLIEFSKDSSYLAATTIPGSLEDAAETVLNSLKSFHYDIAEEKGSYICTDEQMVSRSIEKYKQAPNELFIPINLQSEQSYYLRFIYAEDYDSSELESGYKKLTEAVSVIEKIRELQPAVETSEEIPVDIKFTIGFLEAIKIPTFLTDHEGAIVGYNPSMKKYFSEKNLNKNYFALLKILKQTNSSLPLNEIVDYINSPYGDGTPDEMHCIIKLNNAITRKLTILKIGDTESDRSACFVFVPVSE